RPMQLARPDLRRELDAAVRSFRQSQYDTALRRLQEAALKHPALPPARLMLARLFLQGGEFARARPELTRAIAENPNYPGSYITLGELGLAEGRLEEARQHFQRARELAGNEQWSTVRSTLMPRILEGLSVTAARSRDWDGARLHASAWLQLDPGNGAVRQQLAQALFRTGHRKLAEAELEKAAADDRRLEPPLVSMARLHAEEGDLRVAIQWMDR